MIVGEHPSRVVATGRGLKWFAMSLNDCFRSSRATQNHARPILVERGLIVGEHPSRVVATGRGLKWFAMSLNDCFRS